MRNHSVQWSNVTAWSRSLIALQADMESKMSAFRARHAKHITTTVQVAPTKTEKSLVERIVEFGRELCMEPQRRGRPACAQFEQNTSGISKQSSPSLRANPSRKAGVDQFDARIKDMTKSRETWEKSAVQKIHEFGKQLCEDPKRQSYLSCKQFLDGEKSAHSLKTTNATEFEATDGAPLLEAHLKELKDARKSWEQSVMHQIDSFGKELCGAPSRQGYSACKAFLNSDNVTTAVQVLANPVDTDGQESTASLVLTSNQQPSAVHWSNGSLSMQLQISSMQTLGFVQAESSIVTSVVQVGYKPWGHITPWAQSLRNLQDDMESRMRLRNHTVQWNNMTIWSRSLVAFQADLEAKMSAFQARHAKHLQTADQDAPAKTQADSRKVGADEFNARIKEMTKNREEWHKSAAQEINAFGKQLCAVPTRQSYASCKQFFDGENTSWLPQVMSTPERKAGSVRTEALTMASVVQIGHKQKDHITSWAQTLINLQDAMESRMRQRNHSVQMTDVTTWSRSLMTLQADMEAKMSSFQARHAEHTDTAVQVTPTKTAKSLPERIMEFGRELCMDPQRKGRPACIRFLRNTTGMNMWSARSLRVNLNELTRAGKFEARIKEINEDRKDWKKRAAQKIHAFGKKLCEDPKRQGYSSCKQFVQK